MSFSERLRSIKKNLEKTELEKQVKLFKKEEIPIENLGDLLKDYIDTKGDKYDCFKLAYILNKPGDYGNPYAPSELKYPEQFEKMMRNIDKLLAQPKYAEVMKDLVATNDAIGSMGDWIVPSNSVISDIKRSLNQKEEFQRKFKM